MAMSGKFIRVHWMKEVDKPNIFLMKERRIKKEFWMVDVKNKEG